MREAGILLPVASLPGPYGIGDFGKTAYEFVDLLEQTGAGIWQILPLGPLGYGNSPYQPYSSKAGDEIYLGLDILVKEGLLEEEPKPFFAESREIDYQQVRIYKEKYLRKAFTRFQKQKKKDPEYEKFVSQEWVSLYGVFRTFKTVNKLVCWNEWKKEYKEWIHTRDPKLTQLHEKEIQFNLFLQYEFYKQWMELKRYCNEKKIRIMGDIPFYVGIDSLDVWSDQDSFLLDEEGIPQFVAGVPPDYFAATGQRWGNPIYNWEHLKKTHYEFWMDRIAYSDRLFDLIRIDHFRAFDTYWKIPASCPTAVEGNWIEAPGYELFDLLYEKQPGVHIVAEDLGDLRPEVHKLKNHYRLKGMKIVEFTFPPQTGKGAFRDKKNMIIYTGTHDNETILGWYQNQSGNMQRKMRSVLWNAGYHQNNIGKRFLSYTLDNKAEYAVIPMQDILGLGDEARLNTPGTVGSPNWEWKMSGYQGVPEQMEEFGRMLETSGRLRKYRKERYRKEKKI